MRLPERSGSQVRIGVAVTVPEPFGSQLRDARARFGDPWADFIPPHITLLPPTVLEPDDLDKVDAHLEAIAAAHPPFVLQLRGTATFQPVSPVVFVQVVQGISSCEQLERTIRTGPLLQELQFPYHPHVTIAHEVAEEQLDAAFHGMADFDATFVVSTFHGYLHGDDDVWRPTREFPLTGAPLSDADAARVSAARDA